MDGSKKWHAVYTRPGQEKKVAEILTRRKIENYCPFNKLIHQYGFRKMIVDKPLFPFYVFARITENEVLHLKQTSGVINLVYWLSKPLIIREREIEMIKKILNGYRNVKLEKTLRGPMMEHEGQIFSIKNKTIKIMLPSLGYLMIAEAETIEEGVSTWNLATLTELSYSISAVKQ